MARGETGGLFVDFDGTLEKSAVKKTIEERLLLPLRGRALEVATNITFTIYDILDLGKQRMMDKTVPGMSLELNGPVLDAMYECMEKGIRVTVLTKNKRAGCIEDALKERGIDFRVQYTEDKVSFVRERQAQNPAESVFLLDDSIKDALRFLSRGVDGYVLYSNGHNGIAARFLKPFVQIATDSSLKDLARKVEPESNTFVARACEKVTA